jgi:predicted secreted protein
MAWFTGVVLYVLIWWSLLFAVLPFSSPATSEADPVSGWRGTPTRPFIQRTILRTTVITTIVWLCVWALIHSGWISFHHGWFAMTEDQG